RAKVDECSWVEFTWKSSPSTVAARSISPRARSSGWRELLGWPPTMQLPDEAVAFQYQGLLQPAQEDWTPAAELRARHFLPPARLKALAPRLLQVRSQVAAERDLAQVPPELQPLESGFIDLPQKYLDDHRRKGDASMLGRVISRAG